MPDEDPVRQNEPRKRRKIALACERCRDRKIRCDGHKPACGACQRRSNPRDQGVCIYVADTSARSLDEQEYIQALQNRIRFFEARYASEDSRTGHHVSPLHGADATGQGDRQVTMQNSYRPLLSEDSSTAWLVNQSPSSHMFSSHNRPAESFPCAALGRESPLHRAPRPANLDSRPPLLTQGNYVEDQSQEQPEQTRSDGYRSSAQLNLTDAEGIAGSAPRAYIPQTPIADQESPVNAMGAATTSTRDDGSRDGFYGPSSAISFFHQVQGALDPNVSSPAAAQRLSSDYRSKQRPQSVAQLMENNPDISLDDFSLPPRALADQLMEVYWQRAHYLFPIFHKPSFQIRYRKLWEADNETQSAMPTPEIGLGSFSCPSSVFQCALNAVFALGCNFSTLSSLQRKNLTEKFSRRSLDLLLRNLLDTGSLALVQALLLVAQYLQSTDLPSRCWNIVGLAIRIAQGLGLYIDNSNCGMSILETEIRRRTWHGCLMLDILTGMTLGRPITASGVSKLPLPVAVDDEFLELDVASCKQPDDTFSKLEFFVQALKLYTLMGEILTQLYTPWQQVIEEDRESFERWRESPINMVVDLECALFDFESGIPNQLHWERCGSETNGVHLLEQQRNALHARFLHLKLLLHRPVFHQLYGKPTSSQQLKAFNSSKSLSKAHRNSKESVVLLFAQGCATTCVQTAQDLIALVGRTFDTHSAGAWWYNVFYIFTSAIVLIMADIRLSPPHIHSLDGIEESWQNCLKILERMSPNHSAAEKCARTLIKLREQTVLALGSSSMTPSSSLPQEDSAHHPAITTLHQPMASPEIFNHVPDFGPLESDHNQFRQAQWQDIFSFNTSYPLPWESQELGWWDGFLNEN